MYSTSWKLNSCPPTESHSGSSVKVAPLPQSRDRPEKTEHIVDMNIVQHISNREDRFCGNFKVYPPDPLLGIPLVLAHGNSNAHLAALPSGCNPERRVRLSMLARPVLSHGNKREMSTRYVQGLAETPAHYRLFSGMGRAPGAVNQRPGLRRARLGSR